MIFFRKGHKGVDKKGNPTTYDFEDKINAAVFPGLQGGPHNQSITALATGLHMAKAPEFREYQEQVLRNTQSLCKCLEANGITIVSGGSDNHLLLLDLRSKGVNGGKTETICEQASIVLNKNTVPGDKSALFPSGLRVGAPAMTSRGLVEEDFARIGEFLAEAVEITIELQNQTGKKMVDFKKALSANPPGRLLKLKSECESFASAFPTIGF
jgi:glycine hydroxymethyltransferase